MSNIKTINEVMWAVVDKDGIPDAEFIRESKRQVELVFGKEWAKMLKDGYTCQQVRVRIEPINTDNNG